MSRFLPIDVCKCEIDVNNPEDPSTWKFVKQCQDHQQDTVRTVVDEVAYRSISIELLKNAGIKEKDIKCEFEKKGGGRRLLKVYTPPGSHEIEGSITVPWGKYEPGKDSRVFLIRR